MGDWRMTMWRYRANKPSRSQQYRPHIRPPRSFMEKVLLALIVVALLTLVAITAYSWPSLPPHFGAYGNIHVLVSRNGFLVLPCATLALTIAIAAKLRYPWTFTYAVDITPENVAHHYRRARLRLTTSILSLATTMVIIQWQTIQFALGGGEAQLFHSIDPTILFVADLLIPIVAFELIVRLSVRAQ
jgi:hypothetical protein